MVVVKLIEVMAWKSQAASRHVSIDATAFQQFVLECRQPFEDVLAGTESDKVAAAKQLRTFLVASFEKAKVESVSSDGKNFEWIYQLYSLSKAPIQVCKTAYIAVTGISSSSIEYAQKQIRNHISSESLLLNNYDIAAFDRGNGGGVRSLEEAFDYFGLDYHKFSMNNTDNNILDINNLPDNPVSFICATYLIDWFNLSGEMEVSIIKTNKFILHFIIFAYKFTLAA